MRRLILGFCIVIVACSNDQTNTNIQAESVEFKVDSTKVVLFKENDSMKNIPGQAQNDEFDFLEFYQQFTSAIISKKGAEVDSYLYPNSGIYIIESNGAIPMMTQFYRYSYFDHKESVRLAFESLESAPLVLPKLEPLPKVICDEEIYDKKGCFAQEINPLLESRIWNYASLNEKQIQAIEFLAETVKMTVINTSNFTFYFSKIEGKWYLTFLDLRVPCSA